MKNRTFEVRAIFSPALNAIRLHGYIRGMSPGYKPGQKGRARKRLKFRRLMSPSPWTARGAR